MSVMSSAVPAQPSRAIQGILCIEAGMLFFVVQDVLMKSLLEVYPVWILISLRGIVSILILTPIIAYLGGPHRLWTPLWRLHLLRGALLSFGFTLFYTAFPFMGLAEVTTIFFSAPLITALLATLWLKETIGPHRIGALVLGFGGVVIAMNPTSDTFSWIAILSLICAVCYAISQIVSRIIGEEESSLTAGLYMLSFSVILILPAGWIVNQVITFDPEYSHLLWAVPTDLGTDLIPLIILGISGMIGSIFLSRAYQVANASMVAPFDYTYLPFAAIAAFILWQEVPPTPTLIGMGMIMLGGIYLGYREVRATRKGDEI